MIVVLWIFMVLNIGCAGYNAWAFAETGDSLNVALGVFNGLVAVYMMFCLAMESR